ncbi:MAG: hypothetical protein QM534_13250 [Sediminibacterium sp.]|nr:hypothetical protein [Sediminibacterium sp.]
MKRLVVIANVVLYCGAQSQTDTVKKIAFKAMSFEFMTNTHSSTSGYISPSKFIQEGTKDPLLNSVAKSKDAVYRGVWQMSGHTSPMYSVRSAFRLPIAKSQRHEATIGMRYRRISAGGSAYEIASYDTISRYVSSQTPPSALLEIERTVKSYQFNLSARQVGISLGWNYVTNQTKRIWASFGAEVIPGVNFDQTYGRIYYVTLSKGYVEEGKALASADYKQNVRYLSDSVSRYTDKLKQTSFSLQLGTPVSVNVRLGKKMAVWNKIDLGVSIYPCVYFADALKNNLISNSSINAGMVVRYNLNR